MKIKLHRSSIPNEEESKAYFLRAGYILESIQPHDVTVWLLTSLDGKMYFYPSSSSSVGSLYELWQQWWLKFKLFHWHHHTSELFAQKYHNSTPREKRYIDHWMDTLGVKPSFHPDPIWPWSSGNSMHMGGPLQLTGWPWHEPVSKRSEALGDMPSPFEWMEQALIASHYADHIQPKLFIEQLKRHIQGRGWPQYDQGRNHIPPPSLF